MILLVASPGEMREDVEFFLDLAGYRSVHAASSFGEALTLLSERTHELPAVDVILLGGELDDIDVVGACQILASAPHWRDIPVVLLRQNVPATKLEAALAAGVFDFINMPIFPTEFSARLRAAEKWSGVLAARHKVERELIDVSTRLQVAQGRYDSLSEEWRRDCERDALTRLHNKRWFHERLGLELRSASRRGTYLSLLFLDLDHFQSYNERYGREAGDACLAEVATALKEALQRAVDSVARVGGEEFAVILPDTNARGAAVVATKILALIKALAIGHDSSPVAPHVTASIGIDTRLPTPRLDNASMILAAGRQLGQAKKMGRNRFCISLDDAARTQSILDKLF